MTNPIAPGQVSQATTRLEQEVRELRQLVEELQRKDLSNANVGQGGRLRGLYGNGAEAFMFGKDPDDGGNKARIDYSQGGPAFQIRPSTFVGGSAEQLEVLDQFGNVVISTDFTAGYGLQNPHLSYTMCGYEQLGLGSATTQAAGLEIAKNIGFAYNYARHVISRIRIVNSSASAATVGVFLQVLDFNANPIVSSGVQTFSINANAISVFDFERMVPLTEDYMSTRVQTVIKAYSSAGSVIQVQAMPYMCAGLPQNWYDSYPSLH